MFLVTREQRQKTGDPAFVDRVMTHFRRYHAEAVAILPDDVLRRRVTHGIERGRTYGLTWEYSLTVFLAHMMRIHPEFDRHPAIQRELHDPARGEPDERIDALATHVSEQAWDEAAQQGDPEAYWSAIGAPTPRQGAPR
ncbi:hypothetical protein [Chondromyces apiculatus]|uniref:Uncharacterized protein n=1 Tax=Chondromyces apiculatus DSM 436 TaxID=1192034 RepID=A0A017T5S6_9BACT|nr:hypothetical protein [Chondromyces apiculatus]EYF04382.1 Hypothetical protein CAP_4521 [Chondromyces apiculatus DSM 436]